mmetsp:Transcript_16991/g.24207  ORF Transcript_16991/g.24207 Transcript_16991/m.24207 type:complete len:325 (+) Transcript_16991:61-1035(+)
MKIASINSFLYYFVAHCVLIEIFLNEFTAVARSSQACSNPEEGDCTLSLEELQAVERQLIGSECNPVADVNLADYSQWRVETGYWLGDYSVYKSTGEPHISKNWPYPYGNYKGFITGNVEKNAYRQRNVFVYPPLPLEECDTRDKNVLGNGTCGTNGNTKVFFADQNATTCSNGDISGDYQGIFRTTTNLIGPENAVLYQVFLKKGALGADYPSKDCLSQSQLTSFTQGPNGELYRTRTAQGFQCFIPPLVGQPTYASYYREHKVDKEEFYTAIKEALVNNNVLDSDKCAWMDSSSTGGVALSSYTPGYEACIQHLEQAFEIFA